MSQKNTRNQSREYKENFVPTRRKFGFDLGGFEAIRNIYQINPH